MAVSVAVITSINIDQCAYFKSCKSFCNLQYEVHVVGADVAQIREESKARIENSPE